MRRLIGRLLPTAVKAALKARLRDASLRRAVTRLRGMTDEQIGNPEVLRAFRASFGNEGFAGDCRFLSEAAARASRSSATILECGSGASTIILGLLTGRHNNRVVSLEQDESWCRFIRRDLARLGITNVDVHHAPLRDFGEYDWYDVDAVDLPARLDSALCDGPAFCRGWRSGLLPVLVDRGIEVRDILCDDADDPHAPAMLRLWAERYGATIEMLNGSEGSLAVVYPLKIDSTGGSRGH